MFHLTKSHSHFICYVAVRIFYTVLLGTSTFRSVIFTKDFATFGIEAFTLHIFSAELMGSV